MAVVAILGNQTDHFALVKFKELISSDPYGTLESWNSSTHFCKWRGITCNPMNQRVIELNLEGHQFHGFLSPHVGNLTLLQNLDLGNNSFYGKIPQALGQLLQLQNLYLSNNSFVGKIPTNLTYCSNLKRLFLDGNNLIGKIPIEIGSLKKLESMAIYKNKLTGGIPSFIMNLSCLTGVSLARNNLEGDIPQTICRLKNLIELYVGENKLSGSPPSCLYNISSLTKLYMELNIFHGPLPVNMFRTLPNIQEFGIGVNQFSCPIPTSINASSSIKLFDISDNNFVGQVPSLGKLKDLYFLSLQMNNLGNNSSKDLEFLKTLTNCSKLHIASFAINNFGGVLPNSIGNLSNELKMLYFGNNMISGKIPSELGHLIGLISLSLHSKF
ncbi:hypothetical protein P8452_46523 [Trifolium repens]|nr:hypothetical protein P8452_46523 [Trifolium repens]